MNENYTLNDFMNFIIKIATEKWGKSIVEEILPTLKRTAKAVYKVEKYQLKSEEEPVFLGTIFNYMKEED